jgi:hypothetical protein
LVYNYNFAITGSTVDSKIITAGAANSRSLVYQVENQFLPTYGNKPATANWTAGDSLFAFFFGINDVLLSYTDGNTTRVDAALQGYTKALEKVIDGSITSIEVISNRRYRSIQLAVAIS